MISSEQKIKNLQQAINKDDEPAIIFNAKELLKQFPNDIEYQQCYAIAAIKSKQFQQLGNSIFKEQPITAALNPLYYYFLYSSGQYNKCIQLLKDKKLSSNLRLLLSQSYFNNLQYGKSVKILTQLMRQLKLSQQQRQTYMIDILAGTSASFQKQSFDTIKQFNYLITEHSCKQLFYNYSLSLYGMGDDQQSLKYLNMFEKSLSKQKQDEIDWITVKLFKDYMKMKTHQQQSEAMWDQKQQQYKNMLENDHDANIKCVLFSNLLYLKSLRGEYDSYNYKSLDQLMDPVKNKLSETQKFILRMNKITLLLRKNKISDALKLIYEVQNVRSKQFLLKDFQFVRNKYFALKKNKQYSLAEKWVKQITQVNDTLGFCLMADLARQKGDHQKILSFLQDSANWNNQILKNYIFSLLIKDEVMFEKYSEYLEELATKSNQIKILQILLKLYDNKSDLKKQKSILNRILSINPKSVTTKVKLAQIYMKQSEPEKTQELLRGIQMPEQITDLNYLQYIEKNIHISKKQQVPQADDLKKQAHKKRIKKKKKTKLPKNMDKYVQNYKADPQRWLPKWQRKGYKKKGRKGGKTQGMVTVGKEEKSTYTSGASTSSKQVTKDAKRRR